MSRWIKCERYFYKLFYRILFPFLDGNDEEVTATGLTRLGLADPDDYLCIDSGKE